MRLAGEMAYVFLFGAFLYSLIEITARGYTHWTMTLTGGLCFTFLYYITSETSMNLTEKCLTGALFVTASEFAVGMLVNVIMKWNVWDYSDIPSNICGQVCLPFSAMWFVLCFAGCRISSFINHRFTDIYKSEKINDSIKNSIYPDEETG